MQDASAVTTVKLYYEDAYRTEFEALVQSAEEVEDKKTKQSYLDVVLDRTCFFPEEGGQCPDRGTLEGLPVTDVQIRDGEIHHRVEIGDASGSGAGEPPEEGSLRKAFAPGRTVRGQIDWPFRFSNMQQHSGEHLVSGIVHAMFGYENVGFHLSPSEVTMDYDGVITPEALLLVEKAANEAVWKNIGSVIRLTAPHERENLAYRSKLELEGEVRIVTYPGIDSCACCAPHVRQTGEIGLIKLIGRIKWKGGVRVSMLCGDRALAHVQRLQGIVTDTAGYLTTSAEKIYPQVVRLKEELREVSAALRQADVRELMHQTEQLPPGEDAFLFTGPVDAMALREAVNAMTGQRSGCCGAFSGSDEEGYSFVIGSREKDCRSLLAGMKETLPVRGGGSRDMVQGFITAGKEAILSAAEPGAKL